MSLFVKICGITTVEAADAAVVAGANALGFVFAESPRQLSPLMATEIAREVPDHVEKVAVFLRPQPGEIEAVLDGFEADTVQADIGSSIGFNKRPVLPVVRTTETSDFGRGRLLFEGRRSGVGAMADWSMAADLARRTRLILAGGLNAQNVREAIDSVRPFGVDVSSGVESSLGVKDRTLIKEFVKNVRNIEKEMVKR